MGIMGPCVSTQVTALLLTLSSSEVKHWPGQDTQPSPGQAPPAAQSWTLHCEPRPAPHIPSQPRPPAPAVSTNERPAVAGDAWPRGNIIGRQIWTLRQWPWVYCYGDTDNTETGGDQAKMPGTLALHSGQVWGLIWTKLQEAIFWTYCVVNRCFLGTFNFFRHFLFF